VLLSALGIQVTDRSAIVDHSVRIGIGDEKVITLGYIAEAAGSVDYTYDGTNDNVQFQAALNALPVTGGRLVDVSAVQKNFSATVTRAIPNVTISGSGKGSYFTYNGVAPIFTAGGNGWKFEDLRTDAGGINTGATTGWQWVNVDNGSGTVYDLRTPSGSIVNGAFTASSITDSGLTNGRVPIAGIGGLLGDNANLTFDGSVDTDVATLQDLGALGYSAWVVASNAPTATVTFATTLQDAGYPVWVCDGTNDNVEIQAAISGFYPSIHLSSGNFTLSAGLAFTNSDNGIDFSGEGFNTVLYVANGTNPGTILSLTSLSYSYLHDFYIYGNKANQASGGVGIFYNVGVFNKVSDVWIRETYSHGIQFFGAYNYSCSLDHIWVENAGGNGYSLSANNAYHTFSNLVAQGGANNFFGFYSEGTAWIT
jgi:hypothetical protein